MGGVPQAPAIASCGRDCYDRLVMSNPSHSGEPRSGALAADPKASVDANSLADASGLGGALVKNVLRVLVADEQPVQLAVAALLARGHLLIEDVPGVGKTLLARAMAQSLEARFRRIQFTPDLMPADITGTNIYSPASGDVSFRPGPVFTHILLADEINRATPRTQAALLECMEEGQVTVDGSSRRLDDPFFVVATQNTIEQRGTFPLPEAQLDRFALCLRLGYPTPDQEMRILEEQQRSEPLEDIAVVADVDRLNAAREAVRHVFVEASLRRYIVDLVAATRNHADVLLGASPRASLTLMRCAQAMAVLDSGTFVTPQNIQSVAEAVLAHRLVLRPKPRLAGARAAGVVRHALERVAVPVE